MAESNSADKKSSQPAGAPVDQTCRSFRHFRYVVLLCSGVAMGLMMVMRLAVTVALIGMVAPAQQPSPGQSNASVQEVGLGPAQKQTGTFGWSHEIQEVIITCYMVTYTIFPIVVTRAIMRFGLRISIVVLLSLIAAASMLTPALAYWGWQWVVALRLLMGAVSSGIVPGMVVLIEKWTPPKEASTGIVIYQFTGNIISVLTPLFSGHLAQLNWKLVFYVPGCVTLVFCAVWWLVVSDGPESSRFLSREELAHIRELDLGTVQDPTRNASEPNGGPGRAKHDQLGWLFMFKVRQFWYLAFIWCLYCATSGSMVYLLPTYLHRVLQASVKDVGTFAFLVQVGTLFSMLWPNSVAQFLINRFGCSLTSARRLVVALCILIATATLLYLAVYHQFVVATICLHRFFHMTHDTIFLGTVLSNFGPSGTSGPVYSLLNSIGCINSTIFCVIVGRYLDYTGDAMECWTWVFVTMAVMNILYLLVYSTLCHSDPVEIEPKRPEGVEEATN